NGVVERQNCTLVEAARTMLSTSKLPLSFWVESFATACYTQNRSIIISTHRKTTYHIINDRKPSIKHLHIFGCICYITRDGENLDKMKEKGDPCVMVGYSTQTKGYRVYNKRTRLIVESIHIKFDEIKEMTQNVVPLVDKTDSSQQELEFLFNLLFEGYFTPIHVHAEKNNSDQAANASLHKDEFINPFCTPIQDIAESFSRNFNNTNMNSFQPQSHDYRWTKNHPIEQALGNPTNLVQTRRQLATDPKMCMFALTVSTVKVKDIKEAMADSSWIEAMQDELHQFDRLQVWELIDKPIGKMTIKLKCCSLRGNSDFHCPRSTQVFFNLPDGRENIIFNGPLEEEVCVAQQERFIDLDHPEKVYLLRKALYGLKQAPRAWTSDPPVPKRYLYQSSQVRSRNSKKAWNGQLSYHWSLMYLTSSRPELVQVVCYCARYQARPTQKHLKEVKIIFKYLKGTINMGLWYPKDSGFKLTSFLDNDHAGCIDTSKSTSGGI
ncbi:retrovirus-related pol polyprotein from transposon TNT 1-94, partial [Tanacetum coccineum]